MGTLANHNTELPETRTDKRQTDPATSGISSGGKHHSDPQASRSKSGGASLPDGTLDTPKSPIF